MKSLLLGVFALCGRGVADQSALPLSDGAGNASQGGLGPSDGGLASMPPDGGFASIVGEDGATIFTPTFAAGSVGLQNAICDAGCHIVTIVDGRSTPSCQALEGLGLGLFMGDLAPGTYQGNSSYQLNSSSCANVQMLSGLASITFDVLTPTEASGSYEATLNAAWNGTTRVDAGGTKSFSGRFDIPVTCGAADAGECIYRNPPPPMCVDGECP